MVIGKNPGSISFCLIIEVFSHIVIKFFVFGFKRLWSKTLNNSQTLWFSIEHKKSPLKFMKLWKLNLHSIRKKFAIASATHLYENQPKKSLLNQQNYANLANDSKMSFES